MFFNVTVPSRTSSIRIMFNSLNNWVWNIDLSINRHDDSLLSKNIQFQEKEREREREKMDNLWIEEMDSRLASCCTRLLKLGKSVRNFSISSLPNRTACLITISLMAFFNWESSFPVNSRSDTRWTLALLCWSTSVRFSSMEERDEQKKRKKKKRKKQGTKFSPPFLITSHLYNTLIPSYL